MRYAVKVRGIPPKKHVFVLPCSFVLHGRIWRPRGWGQSDRQLQSTQSCVESAGSWENAQHENHHGPNWQNLPGKQVLHLCNCL